MIPQHGIQLETHRGLPGWPPFISRRFIPLPTLQDVIINEGLRGWNVRFYLAVVKKHPISGYALDVVFEVSSSCCLVPHTQDYYADRTYSLVCPFSWRSIMGYKNSCRQLVTWKAHGVGGEWVVPLELILLVILRCSMTLDNKDCSMLSLV